MSLLNKEVAGWEKIMGKAVRMMERGGSAGIGVGFFVVVVTVVVTVVEGGMMPSGIELAVGVGGIVFVMRGGFDLGYCVGNSDLVGLAMKSPKSSSAAGAFCCWVVVVVVEDAKPLVSKSDNDVLLPLRLRPRLSLEGAFAG